jgi:hypothetical protein
MAINMILSLEQAQLKIININRFFARHRENARAIFVVEFVKEILQLRINFTKYTRLIRFQHFISYFPLNHWKLK